MRTKEFSPSQFAQDAGWDFGCIESTARLGVSEVDVDTIQEMGFGDDEVQDLLAHCRALVEQSKQVMVAEQAVDFAAAVALMDDEVREQVHAEFEGSNQEFVNEYAAAHAEKFGEAFVVN